MYIGVPKEIKNREYRVGMVPSIVAELTHRGHRVNVETNAGGEIGFSNQDYIDVGATICDTAEEVFANSQIIVKVKEPQAVERKMLNDKHILFTYLHLAPDPEQTNDLVNSGAVCIAYETITSPFGGLPLLTPMSEVAGRMSIQAGASCLEKSRGGRGVLLGGVPGVSSAKVVIIGGGVVGNNATQMAIGTGAQVVVLDTSIQTLNNISKQFDNRVQTIISNRSSLEEHVLSADLVIGGVLIPGAAAPKLITKEMIKKMKKGSVVVDVAIDQGGCFETSKATTHDDPTYIVDGVVHYCVANMPGAVARTSTLALNNATMPYILKLADNGWEKALVADNHFANGLNVCHGKITNEPVASALNKEFSPWPF